MTQDPQIESDWFLNGSRAVSRLILPDGTPMNGAITGFEAPRGTTCTLDYLQQPCAPGRLVSGFKTWEEAMEWANEPEPFVDGP